jgi:hypothetical protein
MRVQRRVAAAEGDLDDVPVALVSGPLANGDHAAGGGRSHLERPQNPDVDPGVPAPGVVAER